MAKLCYDPHEPKQTYIHACIHPSIHPSIHTYSSGCGRGGGGSSISISSNSSSSRWRRKKKGKVISQQPDMYFRVNKSNLLLFQLCSNFVKTEWSILVEAISSVTSILWATEMIEIARWPDIRMALPHDSYYVQIRSVWSNAVIHSVCDMEAGHPRTAPCLPGVHTHVSK